MIINDVHLAGFKLYSPQDNLDIRSIDLSQILSLRGENKRFIFKAILAIIFGMQPDEKGYFQSADHDTVFTGRIILQYEKINIFIERDFVTGIIAVLSMGKKAKSIFQGKSSDNLPLEDDPYQDFLHSIFSFIKKDDLLAFCQPILDRSDAPLGEALNRLYLFLRPKFNIAFLERHEKLSLSFLHNINGELLQERETANSAKVKLNLYHLLRQINHGVKNIEHDKYLLEEFLSVTHKGQISEKTSDKKIRWTEQREHLAADIEVYQAALNDSQDQKLKSKKLKLHQNEIKSIISKELLVYVDLPDTFEDDFHRYQKLSSKIVQQKSKHDNRNNQIEKLIENIKKAKRSGIIYSAISGTVLMIIGFSWHPEWQLFNTMVAATAVTVSAAIFKHKTLFFSRLIDTSRRQQIDIRHQIKKYESEITLLRQDAFLVDDLDSIDEHIENFHRFKKLRSHLKKLNEKSRYLEQTEIQGTDLIISRIERRYPLIALSRPKDRKEFLHLMKAELKNIEQQETLAAPPEEHIHQIIKQYGALSLRLKAIEKKLIQKLPPEADPSQIDQEVQRLNRFILFKNNGFDIIP